MDANCLSVKQPYAKLIMDGLKTTELRSWNTDYRGVLYIHASAEPDQKAMERFKIDEAAVPLRAVIGRVLLYNTVFYDTLDALRRDYRMHRAGEDYMTVPRYGFLMRQPEALKEPVPMRGGPYIFNIRMRELEDAQKKEAQIA